MFFLLASSGSRLNTDETVRALVTVTLAAVAKKSKSWVPPYDWSFLLMNQFCSGSPDWATDVHLIIPQTQARDAAVLNTWLPAFTDILSRWKGEEPLSVSVDFNGTSCTGSAQSRMTLCGPVAHATSTHIFKGEKRLAGAASLAQLYPLLQKGTRFRWAVPAPAHLPTPCPRVYRH